MIYKSRSAALRKAFKQILRFKFKLKAKSSIKNNFQMVQHFVGEIAVPAIHLNLEVTLVGGQSFRWDCILIMFDILNNYIFFIAGGNSFRVIPNCHYSMEWHSMHIGNYVKQIPLFHIKSIQHRMCLIQIHTKLTIMDNCCIVTSALISI